MRLLVLLMVLSVSLPGVSQEAETSDDAFIGKVKATLLPLDERAAQKDAMTLARFEQVLPAIMRRHNLDMWVIIAREYNEDPVMETMLPAKWLSARRRTMLVFYDPGNGQPLERLAVAKYAIGELFERAWDEEAYPDQYQALAQLIEKRDPARIGINRSERVGLADGLSATEYELLKAALAPQYQSRLISAEDVAINYLETRTPQEMTHFEDLVKAGHALIARAFSSAVVIPGETTTEDIEWWLRDHTSKLGLSNWFHPHVSVQRASATKDGDFSGKSGAQTVQAGDLLHVDFGMTYLGLNSDQQQHAYVLQHGESQAPKVLQQALVTGNQLQDILTRHFAKDKTGNAVLAEARQAAIDAGITPMIYTHPIGFHGHAAGTTIGMWDAQEGVPVTGEHPLHANTAYSIELNAAVTIPKWGGDVRIMLEEEAFFDGKTVEYLDGRQESLHLIHQAKP